MIGTTKSICFLLAFFWGISWALFLQRHPRGRFLAAKRTWLTVVIGVGVDLLLAYPVVPLEHWLTVVAVVVLSSVGVIARSLRNEQAEEERALDAIEGKPDAGTGE